MYNVRDFNNLSEKGCCQYLEERLNIDWDEHHHGYENPRELLIQANTLLYNIGLYDQNTGWVVEKVKNGRYLDTTCYGLKLIPNKDWDMTKIHYAVFFPCVQDYTFIAVMSESGPNGVIERFIYDEKIRKYISEEKLKEITYDYLECPEAYYTNPEIYRDGQLDWLKEVGILEPDEDLDPRILDNVYVFELQ